MLSSGSHTFCHPASRTAFLSLTRFWPIRERLCMNRVKSLSSIRCMSLGYIFEPKLSIRALGTVGSVVNINSSLNGCSHTKTQFDAKKQDWLVQKFGFRRRRRFFLRGGGSVHGLVGYRCVCSLVSVAFVLFDQNYKHRKISKRIKIGRFQLYPGADYRLLFISVLNLWNIVSNRDDLSRVKYLRRSLNICKFMYFLLFTVICMRKNYV